MENAESTATKITVKNQHKIIIVCIAAILGFRICLSNEKKKENNLLPTNPATIAVSIQTDFKQTASINPKIFGVNIGFAFARELDKDSGFVQLLRDMHPVSLRFPGGTVANWYHPNLPVYGYKANEIIPSLGGLFQLQTKRSENILGNFIRLCKAVNCGAVFCANLLTGTTDEALYVIDALQKNNIPILGVELGNEFCLLPYRKQFPDVPTYIDKIKNTAAAIRKKYPHLRIAVISGDAVEATANDERSKFMRNWSLGLSKQNFFDSYVWHFYASCTPCDKDNYFDNVFTNNLTQLAPYTTNKLYKVGLNYVPIYGKERKLWITEWNISNGDFLDNTFVQGAYVAESFLYMIELNIKYNNYIELTNLHAMDGLINIYKGKQSPILSIGNDNATVQYFAFKFLASTLTENTQRGTVSINSEDKSITNNFICQAFIHKKDNKTYLHFVNRSGKKIEINLPATAAQYSLTDLEAEVPYATAGKTNYEKNYPNKVQPVHYRTETFTVNKITIAPYAFGYISY